MYVVCTHWNHLIEATEYTQHTTNIQKIGKTSLNYTHLPADLALLLTLCGSNYSCLEQSSMVLKMFGLLRFDCKFHFSSSLSYQCLS